MRAVQTDLSAGSLSKAARGRILGRFREWIPAGVGKSHEADSPLGRTYEAWLRFEQEYGQAPGSDQRIRARASTQFWTLGSGNHFAEVSSDVGGSVWLVVHSGSRGPGNMLAQMHIKAAKEWGKANGQTPENSDLCPLIEGTDEFDAYIADMLWAQAFALWQRRAMMDRMLDAVAEEAEYAILDDIDCHHNYSEKQSDGSWLSRKGAIDASEGAKGVIPGSMGALSYIVAGKGNPDSYNTAPHGAGRLRSRGAARRELDLDEFKTQMGDRVWQDRDAQKLIDEAPDAYKPIDVVMEDAKDLVEPKYELTQFVNFKGL
jgi:tRNA-splicing ligase RtcB